MVACVYVCVYACVRAPAGVRCNCSIRMQGQRGYLKALRVNVDKYLLVGESRQASLALEWVDRRTNGGGAYDAFCEVCGRERCEMRTEQGLSD